MPLRDHFHRPMTDECDWTTLHGTWITTILQRLNAGVLPDPFVSRSFVHLGSQVEVDVSALERQGRPATFGPPNGHPGGVAVAPAVYTPPPPAASEEVGFTAPDLFEVRLYRGSGGWKLVAAVELVSEANKDRAEHRRAFAVKCGSYLQAGVSVVVVDVVTNRSGDLHGELAELLGFPARPASPTGLSAVAYKVVRAGARPRLDIWYETLGVGDDLPTVPLWLAPDTAVPLELELTYAAAFQSLRLD